MSSVAPGLQRKLSKVLGQKTDSPEVSKDLSALSTIYSDNSAYNRRNIRSIIEKGLIESSTRFVEDAETIMGSIDTVCNDLARLGSLCDTMSSVLSEGELQCSNVLNDIERLEHSISLTESKKEWLDVFQEKYQLPREYVQTLQEGVINEAFIDALKKVQIVHSNCRSLGLSYHHKAGLALLDELSALQDEAFKHVCSWIQAECQSIESPDAPEIADMIPKAMKLLRSRPPLYSYCAEEIAMARRTAVFEKFIQALSQGPRPIEMHAADPWRYANDMLAWMHAAIASEMELVGNLFQGCYDSRGLVSRTSSLQAYMQAQENNNKTNDDDSSKLLSLQEIMDTIFDSICRPLKLRLDQILMAAPSPVLNFQLTTLFGFYVRTIQPVMGEDGKLSHTLRSCQSNAEKLLRDQMKQRGDRLVRQPPLPPQDLSMPDLYSDRLSIGVSIIKFYESSLLHKDDTGDASVTEDDEFESLLFNIMDPIIDSVIAGADALNPKSSVRLDDTTSAMNPNKQYVYIINCLCHIRRQIESYESASALVKKLQDKIEETMDRMVATDVSRILEGTLLRAQGSTNDAEKAHITVDGQTESNEALDNQPLSEDVAAQGAIALWSKLEDPSCSTVRADQAIIEQGIRNAIADKIASSIVDVYTNAYHAASRSALISSIHPPEDVKTLLGA
mmetsp:Transcript_65/g.135  ORF Transcript_65/g.135 Transcript_65/m.135 type:complete len:675 (-) Transcript_65:26-2050(-)